MAGIEDKVKVNMRNRPTGFIGELVRRLRGDIMDDTPVDTGRLEGGWRAKGKNTGVMEFWNNTDYAEWVEWGNTRGARAQRMMTRNLTQKNINSVARDVQKDLTRKKKGK